MALLQAYGFLALLELAERPDRRRSTSSSFETLTQIVTLTAGADRS